jgi:hypothetical protein
MNFLEMLPYSTGITTRQISAENPTGEKGGGCKCVPDLSNQDSPNRGAATKLGLGWKVKPFIKIKAGETVILADIQGPGCINEFFITSNNPNLSELVLRFFWDDEAVPSVESPMGAFFAIGHDTASHTVSSLPVTVAPYRGCNCYWQMPFRKRVRITLTHEGEKDGYIIAYRVLYKLYEISDDASYFHAQYRRTLTTREYPEHIILDSVKGKGLYVGTYLAWNAFSTGWWGEGEVKFYIDGDTEFPSFADNGTEDYFGGAWCFHSFNVNEHEDVEQVFNTPFLGMPLAKSSNTNAPRKFSLYRWHILDSIGFSNDLKVTVQALGWWPNGKYQPLTDDVASVAYWYQNEPHNKFPILPSVENRWDR